MWLVSACIIAAFQAPISRNEFGEEVVPPTLFTSGFVRCVCPVASRHYYTVLYCSLRSFVGTRFPLRVTSNLGPYCILGLSTTPLIRCIIDSSSFPPTQHISTFYSSTESKTSLSTTTNTGNLYVLTRCMSVPHIHRSLRPGLSCVRYLILGD